MCWTFRPIPSGHGRVLPRARQHDLRPTIEALQVQLNVGHRVTVGRFAALVQSYSDCGKVTGWAIGLNTCAKVGDWGL
jgi:hypothetical protein